MKNYNPEFVLVDADVEQEVDSATLSQTDSFYNFKEIIDIKIGYADQIKQLSNGLEDLVIVLPPVYDDV